MKTKSLAFAVATALSVVAGSAFAASVAPGTYNIFDAQSEAQNPGGSHGLYLVGIPGTSSYDQYRWSITSGTATVGGDGSLSFSAEVKNLWAESNGNDARLQMDVSLDPLTSVAAPSGPTCQNNACAGQGNAGMSYYEAPNLIMGTLTGLGDLAGATGTLSIYPTDLSKPPQLGPSGSWFQANLGLIGFATWLEWTITAPVAANAASITQSQTLSGTGDINWLLGDSSTVNEIPLPAAGWLMIAGLGGLAALRRRGNI